MQMSQLQPASSLAKQYGVKSTIFGGPGSGKTPLIGTAPRPVMLATESGLLSMRHSNVPVWPGFTAAAIAEFMKWVMGSTEMSNFDTIAIDSMSTLADIILADEESKTKHGLQSYGNMAERVMTIANNLYYMKEKHIVMIAKQTTKENGRQTVMGANGVLFEPVLQKIPYFPGKKLNTDLPHLFDNVMHMGQAMVPGMPTLQRALRTKEIPEAFARDRLGNLDELEFPDLTKIFAKASI